MLILSGQYIPIRFFPEKILNAIYWTPIRFLVDFPVSIATGVLPQSEWGIGFIGAVFWSLILGLICSGIYHLGIKDYEAYGS